MQDNGILSQDSNSPCKQKPNDASVGASANLDVGSTASLDASSIANDGASRNVGSSCSESCGIANSPLMVSDSTITSARSSRSNSSNSNSDTNNTTTSNSISSNSLCSNQSGQTSTDALSLSSSDSANCKYPLMISTTNMDANGHACASADPEAVASVDTSVNAGTPMDAAINTGVNDVYYREQLFKLLLNYVLLAACRTTAGGDSFVLLQDLYGGDGLALCPQKKTNNNEKVSIGAGSGAISNQQQKQQQQQQQQDLCTRIDISQQEILITLSDRYNLISLEDIHQATSSSNNNINNNNSIIMSFQCTTTTSINLKPYYRSKYAHNDDSLCLGQYLDVMLLYKILIATPDEVCKQFITIEPAIPAK